MKRKIVDCDKLSEELLKLLIEKYPNGYNTMDVISFRSPKKNLIDAIEIKTKETIYLIRIHQRLNQALKSGNLKYCKDKDK